jgi:hypothetical protein
MSRQHWNRDRTHLRRRDLTVRRRQLKRGERHLFRLTVRRYLGA